MTDLQWSKALKRFAVEIAIIRKNAGDRRAKMEREARARLRRERGVYFVREYTVKAHFRVARPRKRRKLSEVN